MKEKIEELKRLKRLLIVVDMVKAVEEKGNMAITDVDYIDCEVVDLVRTFLRYDEDVISIQEGHSENSQEFKDFPKHCVLGTDEAELIECLKPFENRMRVIRKNSTCGYVTKEFQEYLEGEKNFKEVVVVGVCLDICVINMAIPIKMYLNEYNKDCEVIVPMNAVETFDSPSHNREEYKLLAKKLLNLNGIKTPDCYVWKERC